MTDKDPLNAAGRIATTWEYLEATVEEAVLELAGCPDYRGRAVTTYLSFPNMWRAMRVLLVEEFGPEFVGKKSRFSEIHIAVFGVRADRNKIIHAEWRTAPVDGDGEIATFDMNTRSSLTATEARYTTQKLHQMADLAMTVHLDLLNFLTTECGIVPLKSKYDLPLETS